MRIGPRIKSIFLLVASLFLLGCPQLFIKEIPLGYDLVLDNKTTDELEVRFFNYRESEVFSESYLLNPLKMENTAFTVSFYENEYVIEEFFKSWYEKTQVFRNDTLLVEWHGPAYYGGTENHFYNTNAWTVQDTYPSSFVDGIFIFTIYPEDLEQGTPP